jgi:putative transcriptional regulator
VAGGPRVHLVRVAGGRRVPRHGHRGVELTLVLQGAYTDSLGRFAVGDVAELDESVDHVPVAERAMPCVCLVVTEGRLVPRSPLARLALAFGGL